MTHRTLTTDAEISAYLHRSRMAILDALLHQFQTVSQIATQMNVHPANLTRQMRVLEQAGLIKLVEKRDNGEKAIGFFERNDFSLVGKKRKHYKPELDALI